jgi:hypothetical protein
MTLLVGIIKKHLPERMDEFKAIVLDHIPDHAVDEQVESIEF